MLANYQNAWTREDNVPNRGTTPEISRRDILVVQCVLGLAGLALVMLAIGAIWRFQSTRNNLAWLNSMQARYYWDHDSMAPEESSQRVFQRLLVAIVGPEFISKLTHAQIDSPKLSDQQLNRIAALRDLEVLSLRSDLCSDSTVSRISQLSSLRELTVNGQRVSFSGLLELRKLSKLRTLTLESMKLTKGELAVLSAALPGVDLNYKGGIEEEPYYRPVSSRYPLLALKTTDLQFSPLPEHATTGVANPRKTGKGVDSTGRIDNQRSADDDASTERAREITPT